MHNIKDINEIKNCKRKHEERFTKTCPECGELFIVESGFSMTGYGTDVCQKCGSKKALKGLGMNDDEVKEMQKIMFKNSLKLI